MPAGVYARYALPNIAEDIYTFSIYAKAMRQGDRLFVGVSEAEKSPWKNKIFNLTTEWQRYNFTFRLSGKGTNTRNRWVLIHGLTGDSIIWIDGLQLEKGEQSTEFSEN